MKFKTTVLPNPAIDVRWLARLVALGLMAASPGLSAARMYHWVDQNTGSVQLAGKPPPWYRSLLAGPRVRVYEHGKVIDDTAFAAPSSAPANNSASSMPAPRSVPHRDPAAPSSAEDPEHTGRDFTQAVTTAEQVEEFKALLEAWDRAQVVQAQPMAPARSAVDSTVAKPSPRVP